MSLIAWVTFVILVVVVILSFTQSKDYQLLAVAIPMLAALIIIPLILTRMSQNTYSDAIPFYEKKAKFHEISSINSSKVSEAVKIRGVVETISFKWLNRPYLKINDGTGTISAVLFTSLRESLAVGEHVEVLGTVMRGFPNRRTQAISAINVKNLNS
jgi:DNA/RNA endonuclease YhcR with UshA esterase domain